MQAQFGHKRRLAGWTAAALLFLCAFSGRAERLALDARLAALGMKESRLASGLSVFSNRYNTLVLRDNSRLIEHNGIGVYLNGPTVLDKGRWYVDKVDWHEAIGFDWITVSGPALRKTPMVLLDPGHGGQDKGAISRRKVEEARVTLDVAKRVGKLLAARGVDVRYTRETQKTLSLDARVALNRKLKPDLFVSIHANATASPAVNGIETFVMTAPGYAPTAGGTADKKSHEGNRNGVLNMRLAYAIQNNLLNYTGATDRGVKRARYYVIKYSPVPAVLVELGFLTHSGEEALMISREYRDRLATGVARGILSYLAGQRKPPATAREE